VEVAAGSDWSRTQVFMVLLKPPVLPPTLTPNDALLVSDTYLFAELLLFNSGNSWIIGKLVSITVGSYLWYESLVNRFGFLNIVMRCWIFTYFSHQADGTNRICIILSSYFSKLNFQVTCTHLYKSSTTQTGCCRSRQLCCSYLFS